MGTSSFCDLNLKRLSSTRKKMKCFIVLATLAVAASALPQYYIADTPEVQAAKAQFAAAWNAAAARNAVAPTPVDTFRSAAPVAPVQHFAPVQQFAPVVQAAPVSYDGLYEDGETWPEAEPYIHEDIPAEAYVHIEPAYNAAPAPVAHVAPVAAGCFNWKGEGVPCRY